MIIESLIPSAAEQRGFCVYCQHKMLNCDTFCVDNEQKLRYYLCDECKVGGFCAFLMEFLYNTFAGERMRYGKK